MMHPFYLAQKMLSRIHAGIHAQAALKSGLEEVALQNRPLVNELVYGTLRYQFLLVSLLERVLPRFTKLPEKMRRLLMVALYSLLFHEATPAYAVIDETVKLLKKEFGQRLANVGNASLRNLVREKDKSDLLAGMSDSVRFSMPPDLIDLWKNAYGPGRALLLAERSLGRPYPCYRFNLSKPGSEEAISKILKKAQAIPIGVDGVAFPPGMSNVQDISPLLSELLQLGFLTPQAAGSLEVMRKLEISSAWQEMPVWDACAGSGGKTCWMLERGLDVKVATDRNFYKLLELRSQCARLNLSIPVLLAASAAETLFQDWHGHILVDAPCSGSGVLARRPDIKMRWSSVKTKELVDLQKAILDNLASLLKPGCELAYITCALNPAENEEQVATLLKSHPDLEVQASWSTPHDHTWLEGMYGTRIRKCR